MTSVNVQTTVYAPLSPIGRPDKDNAAHRPDRPDVRVVKFEKGSQLDSRNQEQEITHAESPEKSTTYTADGMKNAATSIGDNVLEKERYLEFDHDEDKLVWKENDPVSGEQTQFPAKQATKTYGRMDVATQNSSVKPSKDEAQLQSVLEAIQGA